MRKGSEKEIKIEGERALNRGYNILWPKIDCILGPKISVTEMSFPVKITVHCRLYDRLVKKPNNFKQSCLGLDRQHVFYMCFLLRFLVPPVSFFYPCGTLLDPYTWCSDKTSIVHHASLLIKEYFASALDLLIIFIQDYKEKGY